MKNIQKQVYVKENGKYRAGYCCTDPTEVYASLAQDLIAKKLNGCTYIRSIKRTNNYDGTVDITINYDNGVRVVYTVRG